MSSKQVLFTADDWHIRDYTTIVSYDKSNAKKLKQVLKVRSTIQANRDYNARLCLAHKCKMSRAEYLTRVNNITRLDAEIDKIQAQYIDTPIWRKQQDQTLDEREAYAIPIDAKTKEDRIMLNGIVIFNQQIMNQAFNRAFSHMAVGEGTAMAGPNDSSLGIEVDRVNIINSGGSYRASGVTLRWDAVFDILVQTFTCYEAGLLNGGVTESDVIMGARSVLDSTQGVDHEYGNDFLYVRMVAQTLSA